MDFQEIQEKNKEKPPIKKENNKVVNYIPTFNVNDIVTLLPSKVSYSSDLINILNLNIKVKKCKLTKLDDSLYTEVLYLDDSINTEEDIKVRNPYLAEHFKKVKV